MKKTLLATSALIGASVATAGVANAEAPVMTFSGNLSYEYIFVDNENPSANATKGHVLTANEQQSELVWDARGTADNGLEYGANIQWRAMGVDAGTGTFDEAWIDFRGGWGRLFIGSEDGVDGLLVPDSNGIQVGAWGTDGNGANRAENSMNITGASTGSAYYMDPAHYAGDSAKLGYVTPSFGGFSAGISFAPDAADDTRSDFAEDNGASNAIELAARFSTDFSGVGVSVGGSYGFADSENTASAAQANEDVESWRIGASVSVAGFSFAADYLDNDESGCGGGVANCDAGDGFAVGASYSFGPGAISAAYQSFDENLTGVNEIETDIFHVGVNYQVAEGLSARINVYDIDSTDQAAGTADGDSQVVIVGTRVQF